MPVPIKNRIQQHLSNGQDEQEEFARLMKVGRRASEEVKKQVAIFPEAATMGEGANGKTMTEAENGRRFVAKYGANIRYVTEWKEWIAWDGTRWKPGDETGIHSMAKDVAAGLWNEIGDRERNKVYITTPMLTWAKKSNSVQGIDGMIKMARSEQGIPISAGDLDADRWLLNCPNGTIDLKVGELRPHRKEDLITKLCPTPYNPAAKCPMWERFVADVIPGEKLRAYLQRLLGHCLTGDVSDQMLPIFHGEGSNGKSTLVGAVLHVLGEDYSGVPPHSLFVQYRWGDKMSDDMMTLQGKRLMISQETEHGDRLNEARIKQLTGGDRIRARKLYQNSVEFAPTHKLVLCTNHQPQVRGTDYAIWRRLKLIPFTAKFTGKKVDKHMLDKLKAEAEGILAWLVRGCLDWQRGFEEPLEVQMATKRYKKDQDEVGQFIKERCEKGKAYEELASDLWQAFQEEFPETVLTQTSFGIELGNRGYDVGRKKSAPHKNSRVRLGIRLKR